MSRSYVFTGTWIRKRPLPEIAFLTSPGHHNNAIATVLEPVGRNAVEIRIRSIKVPRTTGWRSQNHRINGHIAVIAKEIGERFDVVKEHIKRIAVGMGYPMLLGAGGEPIYSRLTGDIRGISEADASIGEAKILIDAIELTAAELDIRLPEYDEEGS